MATNTIKADFVTTVGRLVQGSILEMQTKKKDGTPLIDKKTQQPTQRAFIAIAIAKNAAVWWGQTIMDAAGQTILDPFFQSIYAIGRQGYPQHFNADGSCKHPRFAWKVMDGDGVDDDGKPNNLKEGMAGHWVVKFGNGYLPKLIHNGKYIEQKDYVKRGYFVRVFGDISPNIGAEVPGVYINHSGVELIAYGPEIKSGPDILALAAAAGGFQLPPGATLTPPAPTSTPNMSAPPAAGSPTPPPAGGFTPPPALQAAAGLTPPPMQQIAPPAAQGFTPPPMQQIAPPASIAPNHGFVQNAAAGTMAPPATPPAAQFTPPPFTPPAAPAAPTLHATPAAQGATLEQWKAQGYTEDVLIAQGIFVRG